MVQAKICEQTLKESARILTKSGEVDKINISKNNNLKVTPASNLAIGFGEC